MGGCDVGRTCRSVGKGLLKERGAGDDNSPLGSKSRGVVCGLIVPRESSWVPRKERLDTCFHRGGLLFRKGGSADPNTRCSPGKNLERLREGRRKFVERREKAETVLLGSVDRITYPPPLGSPVGKQGLSRVSVESESVYRY